MRGNKKTRRLRRAGLAHALGWSAIAVGTAVVPAQAQQTQPGPAVGAVPSAAAAIDEPANPAALAFQPRGVPAGPFVVTPRLGVSTGSNDNLTLTPPAESSPLRQAPISSRFVTWTPELAVSLTGDSIDRYELNLRGEFTRYFSSTINNTDNVELGLDGLNLLDPRTALAWRGSAQDWHDPVGSTDLSLQTASPDHFHAAAAGAVLRHDSEDGSVRTEAELTVSRKRYQNHRDITRLGDVDTAGLVGRYLKTLVAGPALTLRWLAEARAVVARYPSYPEVLAPLDNADTRLLGGWQWEPVEPTDAFHNGSFKLGLQRKDFSGARTSYSGLTWDVVQRWQPRLGTQFDLSAGRAAGDAPGDDLNEVVVRQEALAWTEVWRAGLRSTLNLVNGGNRYHYESASAGGPQRRDHVRSVDVGLRYDVLRNLQVGLNFSVVQRRSSNAVFDYTRRINAVVLQIAL